MSVVNLETIHTYFEFGKEPTESQYKDTHETLYAAQYRKQAEVIELSGLAGGDNVTATKERIFLTGLGTIKSLEIPELLDGATVYIKVSDGQTIDCNGLGANIPFFTISGNRIQQEGIYAFLFDKENVRYTEISNSKPDPTFTQVPENATDYNTFVFSGTTPLFDATGSFTTFNQEINLGSVVNYKNTNCVVVGFYNTASNTQDLLNRSGGITLLLKGTGTINCLNIVQNGISFGRDTIDDNVWSFNRTSIIVNKDEGKSARPYIYSVAGAEQTVNGNALTQTFLIAKDNEYFGTAEQTLIGVSGGSGVFQNTNLCLTKAFLTESAGDLILNLTWGNYIGNAVTTQTSFKLLVIG